MLGIMIPRVASKDSVSGLLTWGFLGAMAVLAESLPAFITSAMQCLANTSQHKAQGKRASRTEGRNSTRRARLQQNDGPTVCSKEYVSCQLFSSPSPPFAFLSMLLFKHHLPTFSFSFTDSSLCSCDACHLTLASSSPGLSYTM